MAVGELTKRVAVAAVGIPIIIAIMYIGGWLFGVMLAVVAGLAAYELFRMATHGGLRPFTMLGAGIAAAHVVWSTVHPSARSAGQGLWILALSSTLICLTLAIWQRGRDGVPLSATAVTVFGAVWVGGTLSCAVFLRALAGPGAHPWLGAALVAFPFVLAWWGDTCAYFAGNAWGKRKLMPTVSPGKTVEGAIANIVGASIVGALYAWLVFDVWLGVPVPAAAGFAAGLIVSPAAQVGDLAESLLKREAGVKDSGRLFPGHGGALDRIDSLLFAIPTVLWYMVAVLPRWVEGLPWQ